jgi:hypothetical protein
MEAGVKGIIVDLKSPINNTQFIGVTFQGDPVMRWLPSRAIEHDLSAPIEAAVITDSGKAAAV